MTTTFSQHKYELCIDLHVLYGIWEYTNGQITYLFLVNAVRWKYCAIQES